MTSSVSDSPIHVSGGRGACCWLFPSFLVLATFIAYIPAWHGGFVWKDDEFILHNPYINFFQGLYRIWFKTSIQYYPLTYTTFWIEYHFWGMNPLGYHLVNIGFHALDAILLWFVLLRLNVPGAWLAAAIFALHPVNVESVAWIVERKNTLSTAFYLCSILAGLKFWLPELWGKGESSPSSSSSSSSTPIAAAQTAPQPGESQLSIYPSIHQSSFYWLALGLFVCALFSKTTTIPLPAVMLLLVWWKRGRIAWRDVYACFPFVVAGIAVGLITHHVEHNLGAAGKEFQFTLVDRVLLAARNFWFYLGKLIWPHPLIFVYPRWTIHPSSPLAWLPLLAFVPVAVVFWLARKTWGRTAFVAFAYFGGMLFLMLGFFNIFFFLYSFVSDHFVYLACMGPIALFAAALTQALCRRGGDETLNKINPTGSSESQVKSETPHVVSYGEGEFRGHGDETLVKVDSSAASRTTEKSETPHVVSYGYLGISACLLAVLAVLTWQQSHAYANEETLWRDTISKNPGAFLAYNNLGDLLLHSGRADDAISAYTKSAAIHPDAIVFHNLGDALLQRGRAAEAYSYIQKALKLQPDSATTYLDLGTYYLQIGRTDSAIQTLQKALQMDPGLAMASYNLGNAYFQNRQLDVAIEYWQKAVDLQPGLAMAHNNLGNACRIKGQISLAIEHWKAAYMAEPNLLQPQVNLAWVWATCPDAALRDGPRALALAEQAYRLTGGASPVVLRALAAALAENGQYSQAIAAAQQALQLSRGNLAATIQSQLRYYQNNQPFRDPSLAGQTKK